MKGRRLDLAAGTVHVLLWGEGDVVVQELTPLCQHMGGTRQNIRYPICFRTC